LIRPLRSAHRAIWSALALSLPLGLVAALAARPELPREDLAALEPGSVDPHEKLIALAAGSPDVLVYWSEAPGAGAALPQDARLLGRADRGLLEQPGRQGSLLLYSLAQRRVIGRLPVSEVLP